MHVGGSWESIRFCSGPYKVFPFGGVGLGGLARIGGIKMLWEPGEWDGAAGADLVTSNGSFAHSGAQWPSSRVRLSDAQCTSPKLLHLSELRPLTYKMEKMDDSCL